MNVIGKGGIFGIDRGASNRVNTSKTLGELYGLGETSTGFTGLNAVQNEDGSDKLDENGNKLYALEINGVKIGEYSVDTTLGTIMNDINKNEKAGVKVSYSTTSNQFVFTSTHGGSGGRIEIGDDGANLAAKLFGAVEYDGQGNIAKVRGQEVANSQGKDFSVIQGQDARMEAYVNGVKTTLTSGTTLSISMDSRSPRMAHLRRPTRVSALHLIKRLMRIRLSMRSRALLRIITRFLRKSTNSIRPSRIIKTHISL